MAQGLTIPAPQYLQLLYLRRWYQHCLKFVIKKAESETWTPDKLLECWGVAQQGKIKSVIQSGTLGGEQGADKYQQAAAYVESVEGFTTAYPVLSWVYAQFETVGSFQPCKPGQDLASALIARRWGFALGYPPTVVGRMVRNAFIVELAKAIIERPFEPIIDVPIQDETDYQIEARAKLESLRTMPKIDFRAVGSESKRMATRRGR